jgi:hypothetical protein
MVGIQPGTLADLKSLMTYPPGLRRGTTELLSVPSQPATPLYTRWVPSEYYERILALNFTLTCSATSGYRDIALQFNDQNGVIVGYVPVGGQVTASSVTQAFGSIQAPQQLQYATTIAGYGSVTTPAAGATVCSISNLGTSQYQANWIIELEGTPSATDIDNFGLYGPSGGLVAQGVNLGSIGLWSQNPVTYNQFTNGVVRIKAIAAGTTGAIYSASLAMTQIALPYPLVRLPNLVMRPGWGVQFVISNAQSGDTLNPIYFLVERYPAKWASGNQQLSDEAEIATWLRWAAEVGQP